MIPPTPITAESNSASREMRLRTGVWYGDFMLAVPIPPSWDVDVFTPSVGKPLTDKQIVARLEAPVRQATIRELCRGKARPVVIVDDLNRPTICSPGARIPQ